jgi:Berberine and berberine like
MESEKSKSISPLGEMRGRREQKGDESNDELLRRSRLADDAGCVGRHDPVDSLVGRPDLGADSLAGWAALAPATAFGHRAAPFLVNEIATWTDQEEAASHIAWARGLSAALQPFSAGSYVNFLAQEGAQVTKAAYTEATYSRLVALKTTYDLTNLFRLNQNIPPREKGAAAGL